MADVNAGFWGGPRDSATAAEAEFTEALERRIPTTLDFWLHEDSDGRPWMLVSLSIMGGPEWQVVVRTLRLDFDASGIRGGWSRGNLNWDDGTRAEDAGVDFGPPDGIIAESDGRTPDELAQLAARWFSRHLV